jgi:hypothetical protein
VPRDDALAGLEVRVERPVPPFMCAAEKDAVLARHHVEVAIERDVVDLGLRQNERELPLDRIQLIVAEEGVRSETGAIHKASPEGTELATS